MINKEAVDRIQRYVNYMETLDADNEELKDIEAFKKGIKALRNQKTGYWIDNRVQTKLCNCSECDALSKVYANYCPHCGAKMKVDLKGKKNDRFRKA